MCAVVAQVNMDTNVRCYVATTLEGKWHLYMKCCGNVFLVVQYTLRHALYYFLVKHRFMQERVERAEAAERARAHAFMTVTTQEDNQQHQLALPNKDNSRDGSPASQFGSVHFL